MTSTSDAIRSPAKRGIGHAEDCNTPARVATNAAA